MPSCVGLCVQIEVATVLIIMDMKQTFKSTDRCGEKGGVCAGSGP